jgi:hypothetical protein
MTTVEIIPSTKHRTIKGRLYAFLKKLPTSSPELLICDWDKTRPAGCILFGKFCEGMGYHCRLGLAVRSGVGPIARQRMAFLCTIPASVSCQRDFSELKLPGSLAFLVVRVLSSRPSIIRNFFTRRSIQWLKDVR